MKIAALTLPLLVLCSCTDAPKSKVQPRQASEQTIRDDIEDARLEAEEGREEIKAEIQSARDEAEMDAQIMRDEMESDLQTLRDEAEDARAEAENLRADIEMGLD